MEVCRAFSRLKNTLMPYLYAQAVQTSATGVPMMRAMLLEFDDLGCEDCDRQYMLGDALLVAPVMRADGVVDYYLPEGTWTHLLTGETENGGGWRRGQYDFFSLPLFVRENTILPVGSRADRPDYDYTDGLTLRLYQIADGAEVTRTVCNTAGEPVLTAVARRTGDKIDLTVRGSDRDIRAEQVGTDCRMNVEYI